MNIIFLDFDGVLDTAYYDSMLIKNGLPSCDRNGRPIFDPRCVCNLEKIIKASNSKIVVTSSWREYDSFEDLYNMWVERNMPGELLDVTPIIGCHRGDEIDKWLSVHSNKTIDYIIIDDLSPDCFNQHHYSHLITINPYDGITEENVSQAIGIFQIV